MGWRGEKALGIKLSPVNVQVSQHFWQAIFFSLYRSSLMVDEEQSSVETNAMFISQHNIVNMDIVLEHSAWCTTFQQNYIVLKMLDA